MQPTTLSYDDRRMSMVLNDDVTSAGAEHGAASDLTQRYRALLNESRLSWIETHRLGRRLGSGGQGVVYLGERLGADQFTLPVALKVFSPAGYEERRAYDEAMARMARVAVRVAQIQQDNLIDVHNFIEHNRIRADGDGMGRRLRPPAPALAGDAPAGARPGRATSAGSISTT